MEVVDSALLRDEPRVPPLDGEGIPEPVNGEVSLSLSASTVSLEPPLRDSAPTSCTRGSPAKQRPASIIAMKNTRKRMEDRHVALHDLKAYLPSALQSKIGPSEHVSFYAVFDGHAGTDAATFAAAHLHELVVESQAYPADPVSAIQEACHECDRRFIATSKKSGTTVVCVLIKDNTIYAAWVGDSLASLVREGHALKIMEPHKPNREDEKVRVEGLGGAIIHYGTWRVNGQLAVSRAIGDGEYKPLITAQPDITTIVSKGNEDFLIIACDGLWDMVTPEESAEIIYQKIKDDDTDLDGLAHFLGVVAKDRGSADNITIIIVFLKPVQTIKESVNDKPMDLTGVSSTCNYVSGIDSVDGRESLEPSAKQTDDKSPGINFSGLESGGGMFSPDPFGQGPGPNGFDMSKEEFDTRLSNEKEGRFSEENVRISGISELKDDEMLTKKSIDKVDDLIAMLDREDCSPNQEEEKSLEEVLAVAREREEEEIDGVVNVDSDSDSDQEETSKESDTQIPSCIVPEMEPCQQVRVVATGPDECGTVVPPSLELPSIQEPEAVDVSGGSSLMSCSMVKEENGLPESTLAFDEDIGSNTDDFMLKTPAEEESVLSRTNAVESTTAGVPALEIPVMQVTPATPTRRSESPEMESIVDDLPEEVARGTQPGIGPENVTVPDVASPLVTKDTSRTPEDIDADNQETNAPKIEQGGCGTDSIADVGMAPASPAETLDSSSMSIPETINTDLANKIQEVVNIEDSVNVGDNNGQFSKNAEPHNIPNDSNHNSDQANLLTSIDGENPKESTENVVNFVPNESEINEKKSEEVSKNMLKENSPVKASTAKNMSAKKSKPAPGVTKPSLGASKTERTSASKLKTSSTGETIQNRIPNKPKGLAKPGLSATTQGPVATPSKQSAAASRVAAARGTSTGTKPKVTSEKSAPEVKKNISLGQTKPLARPQSKTEVAKSSTQTKPEASKPASARPTSSKAPLTSRTPMTASRTTEKPTSRPTPARSTGPSSNPESTTSVRRTTSNASSLRDKKPGVSATPMTTRTVPSTGGSRLTSSRPSSSKLTGSAASETTSSTSKAPQKGPSKTGASAPSRSGPMSAPVKPSAAASRVAAAREAAKAAKKPSTGTKKPPTVKATSPITSPSPAESGEADSVKELPESDRNIVLFNQESGAGDESKPGENVNSNEESET